MDTLDDHNGIVHHNGNGKHHSRKCQQVHAEADELQDEESSDQGYRDSNSRNQGRTHILQEDIYYDEHQDKGLNQSLDNFVDRSIQEVVGILCHIDTQTGRKCFLSLVKYCLQVIDGFSRIGTGHLINDTGYRLVTVYRIVEGIGQTTQLDVCHISQAEYFTVRQRLDYDVLEFFNLLQTSLVTDGILICLVSTFTELSGSGFQVLFGQYSGNVARNQLVLRHYIRLQPDTHRVVLTHHTGITHTLYTLDFRNQVDFRVVFNELDVVFVFFIVQRENQQHGVLTFLGSHTDLGYFGRQQTLSH